MKNKYKNVSDSNEIGIYDYDTFVEITEQNKVCPECGGAIEYVEEDTNDPTGVASQSGYACSECCKRIIYEGE